MQSRLCVYELTIKDKIKLQPHGDPTLNDRLDKKRKLIVFSSIDPVQIRVVHELVDEAEDAILDTAK